MARTSSVVPHFQDGVAASSRDRGSHFISNNFHTISGKQPLKVSVKGTTLVQISFFAHKFPASCLGLTAAGECILVYCHVKRLKRYKTKACTTQLSFTSNPYLHSCTLRCCCSWEVVMSARNITESVHTFQTTTLHAVCLFSHPHQDVQDLSLCLLVGPSLPGCLKLCTQHQGQSAPANITCGDRDLQHCCTSLQNTSWICEGFWQQNPKAEKLQQ